MGVPSHSSIYVYYADKWHAGRLENQFFYEKGINLFRPEDVGGIYGNPNDEHPVSAMYRKKPPAARASNR